MTLNNNFMKLMVHSDDEMFEVEAICRTEGEANQFCQLHPECGVIATDDRNNIIVANVRPCRSVKVTFKNGNTIKTRINGTVEHIKSYYIGNSFNLGTGGQDNMQQAIRVEFLDTK